MDLLEILSVTHDLVICKARQLGISWLVAGYALWKTLFSEAAKTLMLSQGESEAWELLDKSHFIWERLPAFLKISASGHDTRAWLQLDSGSEIKALPSTDRAGKGTDATLVVRDELAEHPFGSDNFTAISPTIDSGGQIVDLSTIKKRDPHNHFTERIDRALKGSSFRKLPSGLEVYTGGESGATLVFAGRWLRPVRQEGMSLEEWFDSRIKPKYTPMEIEENYPIALKDALAPSDTAAFFDVLALEDMQLQVMPPIKDFKDFDTFNGLVRVYKRPVIGRQYIIFTDPSEGIEDPFVTVVMDAVTGEGVCSATGMIPSKEVARIHDYLVRTYGNAFNTGEYNAQAGGVFIDTLNTLCTPNRAPRRSVDGKIIPGKIGWQMNQPLREKALHDLKDAIRTQSITVHDSDAISEFRHFLILSVDKRGHVKMEGKLHDDWVMAWAGAWQIRKYAPIGDWKVTSSKYRD